MKLLKLPLLFCFIFLISNSVYSQKGKDTRRAKRIQKTELIIDETPENDKEVEALGSLIETSLTNNEVNTYIERFDKRSFVNLATSEINDVQSKGSSKSGFNSSALTAMSSIANVIYKHIETDGFYDFVNYYYDYEKQTYSMLFRLFSEENGLNYHEYRISKVGDIFTYNDIYIYLSGETFSKTLSRIFYYSLSKEKKLSIFGKKKSKNYDDFIKASSLYRSGSFREAYNLLKTITGDITDEKFFFVYEILITSNLETNQEHQESVEKMMQRYPNDPSLYLSQVDYYYIKKDFDKASEVVEQLMYQTNDDFLNYLLANIKIEAENYEEAIKHLDIVTNNYPNFFNGFGQYLLCITKTQQFDLGKRILEQLIDYGYEKTAIIEYVEELDENGENIFDGFAKSKDYLEWKTTE